MDIFSAGCVIAELFTESPMFSLSQLFKYRKGEYDPSIGYLSKIPDADIRDLVSHMIQLQPESRYSADEYLNFWRKRAFPEYFYIFLYQYMNSITDPSAGRAAINPHGVSFGDADDRIGKVYHDFDKITYALGHNQDLQGARSVSSTTCPSEQQLPVQVDISVDIQSNGHSGTRTDEDGSLLFLALILSCLRHTARATARIRACDLMLAFSKHITDEAKFDRILPYIVIMLGDSIDGVKVAAVRSLTQLLASIDTVSPVNAYAFPEYVKPRLQHFVGGPGLKVSSVARATYASCLASLALSSIKVIDTVQAMHADGSTPAPGTSAEDEGATKLAYQNPFDQAKSDLLDIFESHTKALLIDKHASVRRALLSSVSSLCVFFGNARAGDVVLSHLNTYLNDKDWMLKCAFFRTMVGVSTFVGGPSIEDFILPLMVQSLNDPEEFVTREVLSAFANMASLGLFRKTKMREMLGINARYLVHSNAWVREAAVNFVVASTGLLSPTDRHCLIAPELEPYLRFPVNDYSPTSLLDALRTPLSRAKFETTLLWASRANRSSFWTNTTTTAATHQQVLPSEMSGPSLLAGPSRKSKYLSQASLNEDDERWLKKLKDIGLDKDDENLLMILKEHISRVAPLQLVSSKSGESSTMDMVIALKDLLVTPHTVFFEPEAIDDNHQPQNQASSSSARKFSMERGPPHTITDALLDASSTGTAQMRSQSLDHPPEDLRAEAVMRRESQHQSPTSSTSITNHAMVSGQLDLPSALQTNKVSSNFKTQVHSEASTLLKEKKYSEKSTLLRQPSTINFLKSRETPKTSAEAVTNATNAIGTLEGPLRKESRSAPLDHGSLSNNAKATLASSPKVNHSYTGSDPAVNKLLTSLASSACPRDILEFGPPVTPSRQRPIATQSDNYEGQHTWRPRCVLTAVFGEHSGPINRVLPAPDHAFFITGSDDGTVKVWDTLRLERNLTTRSRCTFVHSLDMRVIALAFVERTHTFISAASDGSIKVVKIDYTRIGDASKYGRLRLLRECQLPNDEHAVWLDHAKIESSSMLLIATNLSRILAIDLTTMEILYTLINPLHHGRPTCFCVNHDQGWLVVGSSKGVLDLWDLRFQLRLDAWTLAGGAPIRRLLTSPFHPEGRKVFLTGGTKHADVTVWDLDDGSCSEVFQADVSRKHDEEGIKAYRSWAIGSIAATVSQETDSMGDIEHDSAIQALVISLLDPLEISDQEKGGLLFTGGPDRRVRLWNYRAPSKSLVINGFQGQDMQPKYVSKHPSTSLTLHTEMMNRESGSKSRRSNDRQPRNTVISQQQLGLLRSHLDDITDICLLELPVTMTVSVDRLGCIYIFQ